jgi:hypothetical protein
MYNLIASRADWDSTPRRHQGHGPIRTKPDAVTGSYGSRGRGGKPTDGAESGGLLPRSLEPIKASPEG